MLLGMVDCSQQPMYMPLMPKLWPPLQQTLERLNLACDHTCIYDVKGLVEVSRPVPDLAKRCSHFCVIHAHLDKSWSQFSTSQ